MVMVPFEDDDRLLLGDVKEVAVSVANDAAPPPDDDDVGDVLFAGTDDV